MCAHCSATVFSAATFSKKDMFEDDNMSTLDPHNMFHLYHVYSKDTWIQINVFTLIRNPFIEEKYERFGV